MPESVRLIKKYPNRRLYDTQTSAYITLSDVKELVLSRVSFKAVDAKTGENLTRSTLLQIIAEEEMSGVPLFSTELLSQMIRFYGHPTQAILGKYLEKSTRSFLESEKVLHEQSLALPGEDSKQAGFNLL
jgi:polyhydroxyalkanoate synthesis repressor PhaR